MDKIRATPSFRGRRAATPAARRAAQGASKKTDTSCELVLRRALWASGFRYRLHHSEVPGRPDLVFMRQRIAVFCDGDFWHGRNLDARVARLARGHNAPYWTEKITKNVARDRFVTKRLTAEGWRVIRLWETDISRDPWGAVAIIAKELMARDGRPLR